LRLLLRLLLLGASTEASTEKSTPDRRLLCLLLTSTAE
jgi:hypothetical protein